jgi:hypothetical protein
MLELMPAISAEWASIARFKEQVARHPFSFKPFHPLTDEDVDNVLVRAVREIEPYRESVWPGGQVEPTPKGRRHWVKRLFHRWRVPARVEGTSAAAGPGEPFHH